MKTRRFVAMAFSEASYESVSSTNIVVECRARQLRLSRRWQTSEVVKACIINQIMKIIVRYSVRMKVDMCLWVRDLLPAGWFVEHGAKQLQEVPVTWYKVWRMNTQVYKCCTFLDKTESSVLISVWRGNGLKTGFITCCVKPNGSKISADYTRAPLCL
jgi:hypothetical protein